MQAQAEAILLGDHFPPEPAFLTAAHPPGCALPRTSIGSPVAESALDPLGAAREAWQAAMTAVLGANADPSLCVHAQDVAEMLHALKGTLDEVGVSVGKGFQAPRLHGARPLAVEL